MDYHSDATHPLTFDRGDQVARAKRTDRAEARRQYRAYLQAQAEAEAAANAEAGSEAEGAEDDAPERPVAGRWRFPGAKSATSDADVSARPKPASTAAGPQPMGFLSAMRAAYHPVNYGEDLRFLPKLVTRTHAVWASTGLAIAGGAIVASGSDPNDFLFQIGMMMIAPWPIVPAMLAGILAPRAAWLAGAVAGFAAGAVLCVVVAISATFVDLAKVDTGSVVGTLAYYMVASICFGALMGALAAWYKRFLQLVMGPNQRRGSASKSRAKRPARRPQTARR
jgi:hypothetical protein